MGIFFFFLWGRILGNFMIIQSQKFISLNSVYVHRNQIHGQTAYPVQSDCDEYSLDEHKCLQVSQQSAVLGTVPISLCDKQVTWILTRSQDLVFTPESSTGSALNEIMDYLGITHLCSTLPARMNRDTHTRLQKPCFGISTDKNYSRCGFGEPSL